MAPKPPCAKYQYVVTSAGPKILPVDETAYKDEESPADYNAGGYLPVKVNDTVVRKLGWGHFSTVWLVKDSQTKAHSALKVIKLLSKVASANPSHPGRPHIGLLPSTLSAIQGPESSHICIVFEPLGENLLALIERNKKKGRSRFFWVCSISTDECDLVHTDIKPENILISIPDIEDHIHNEISQSPVPSSRRVGVPQPTKSRAGVTIPYNSARARRQVQIFESQPLSSPRSTSGRSAFGNSSLAMSRAPDSGSGTNSQCGSYVAPANLLRMKSGPSIPPNTAFVGGSGPSSSVPKVPSNLSSSFRPPQLIASASVPAPPSNPPIFVKIADMGNATPSKKHYTEDIQTRQYRAPEAIVGRKDWDTRADVWSAACVYSRELFDHTGSLRYIRTLKPWPLKRVMIEKYLYADEDAAALCDFLEPMLAPDFRNRVTVRQTLEHPWLDISNETEAIEW
ncbi:kinase-like protein [Coprinellus micaceus]|uniref:non-specific serine/threonine protein kinase n=1 Tax=Coprinellus micaceus TaxID=71717 RepID=A0A4Y7R8S6_COPMI|nr:kinase-like protein [Coprinellus micaceus]